MHNQLVIEVFKKAKQKSGTNKRHRNARIISDFISEVTEEGLGEARLAQYHRIAEKKIESIYLKAYVEKALCNYLGYASFEEFQLAHPKDLKPTHLFIRLLGKCWFKFILYHIVLVLIGIGIYNHVKRKRWMVWEGKEYVEVKFDTDLYGTRLRVYKKQRIKYFKRVEADCDTVFFNPDGSPKIWYGKNKDGLLQYFTDLGLHPETGKTLRPITQYMIDKYICMTKQ